MGSDQAESAADAAAEVGKSMTSMIDVVFLLLVFFVFTAKFVALEESLAAHLPKDRNAESPWSTVVKAELVIDVKWTEGSATATARVTGAYVGEDEGVEFESKLDRRLGYEVPDSDAVDAYLKKCAKEHGREMQVTVHFENGTPWQVVVNQYDSCARVGMANVTVAAEEIPIIP